jgi:lysophospholipase L1-like esterase
VTPARASGYGSRLIAFALAPLLFPQSRVVLSHLPTLAEASGPRYGSIAGPDPLRLLVFGDSTAAGVGAATQQDALAGSLARGLRDRLGRGVGWQVHARSGVTSGELRSFFLPVATSERFDVVFLSIGVNDVMQLRRTGQFERDLTEILDALRATSPEAWILVPGVPRMERFDSLPEPLGSILGARAHRINRGARHVISGRYRVVHTKPWPIGTPGFFASDQFHPSAAGYTEWARTALDFWQARRAV